MSTKYCGRRPVTAAHDTGRYDVRKLLPVAGEGLQVVHIG